MCFTSIPLKTSTSHALMAMCRFSLWGLNDHDRGISSSVCWGKSTPETHGFWPSNIYRGFSGENCPIIQFYERRNHKEPMFHRSLVCWMLRKWVNKTKTYLLRGGILWWRTISWHPSSSCHWTLWQWTVCPGYISNFRLFSYRTIWSMLLHQHWEQSLSAVCRCVSKIKTTLQNVANIANKTLTTKKCKIDVSPG